MKAFRCEAPSIHQIILLNIFRCNNRMELKWSVPVAIAVIIGNIIVCNHIPRWNGFVIFYGCGFAANLVFVAALLLIVPYFGRKTAASN